jgi:hypothetical protein
MKTKMKKTVISMAASAVMASALTVSAVTPAEAKKAKRKKPSIVLVSRSMTTGQSFNISLKKGKSAKSSNKRVATISPKYIRKGKKRKKVKYKWVVKAKMPGNARISLKKGKKKYVWSILVKVPARPVSRPVQKVMPSKPTPSPKPSVPKTADNQPQINEAEKQNPQMSEAEKQKRLSELKAELEKKQELLKNAKSSQTGSKKALEDATAQYDQAKKAYDEAQKVVKEGSLGFFKSINAQGAIQLLTRDNIEKTSNENVNSFTHMGADKDATSLEGMKDSLDAFKEYEELVKREGLALPRVSTILTAIEQLNCNFYMNNIDYELTYESPHTTWGNKYGKSSECLAKIDKTDSPFKAWYDDEKKTYEEHKDEFRKNPAEAERKYRVGHYFSIKKGSAADRYMGMGRYHGASALGYSLTPCHVSTTVELKKIEDDLNSRHLTFDELDDYRNSQHIEKGVKIEEVGDCKYKVTQTTKTADDLTMSLSEYREKFMAYYNKCVTASAKTTKEMNEKKAAMDSADKKVKEANREITGIENDINAIRTAIASLEK